MRRLERKIAVVTGGANGIGKGCAVRLAQEGAAVAIVDREPDALAEVRAEIEAGGGTAMTVVADCLDIVQITEFVERTQSELGPIDILLNNVGQGARERKTSFLDSSEEVWRFVVEINLFTTMRFTKLIAPGMIERGYGRIVNIASESALIAPVGSHDYAAAKAGIIGFSRAVSREFAASGVTVNVLCPGPVMTRALSQSAGEEAKKAMASIPVGFVGEAEDVAAMAALLASDEGRFITGQTILVNGGRWFV
jgi:acetoacetyl-CoA reductase/3-oxoacyl-[acyl-carrier protein] reductase